MQEDWNERDRPPTEEKGQGRLQGAQGAPKPGPRAAAGLTGGQDSHQWRLGTLTPNPT